MAFRFRKSVKIAPGVRLNLNKKSTSVSFGGKGFHHTISSTGHRTTTTGLPGTGISYSTTESVHKDHGAEPSTRQSNPKVPNNGQNKGCSGCLWVLLALIFWPFALSYWLWTSNKFHASKKARVGIIAAFWAVLLAVIPMRVMPHRPHPCRQPPWLQRPHNQQQSLLKRQHRNQLPYLPKSQHQSRPSRLLKRRLRNRLRCQLLNR